MQALNSALIVYGRSHFLSERGATHLSRPPLQIPLPNSFGTSRAPSEPPPCPPSARNTFSHRLLLVQLPIIIFHFLSTIVLLCSYEVLKKLLASRCWKNDLLQLSTQVGCSRHMHAASNWLTVQFTVVCSF